MAGEMAYAAESRTGAGERQPACGAPGGEVRPTTPRGARAVLSRSGSGRPPRYHYGAPPPRACHRSAAGRSRSWRRRRRLARRVAAPPSTSSAPRSMSFESFRARVRDGSLVPVWRDCLLDTDTPVSAFAKLRRGPFAFLLESAPAGSETWARYTYMGTEPRRAWRLRERTVEDWTPAAGWHAARDPADPIADLQAKLGA